jgi:hypothetical protein
MPNFTTAEIHLVKNIVARLTIKTIQQETISKGDE